MAKMKKSCEKKFSGITSASDSMPAEAIIRFHRPQAERITIVDGEIEGLS